MEYGIEIRLGEEDDFLKIKETLTRIGIASRKNNTLYQSVMILHKQGSYYLMHFKEMFALDGRQTDISEEDYGRRNTIANLLEEWGLCRIVDKDEADSPKASIGTIKILPFKDKDKWNLESKYTFRNAS